jgi:hypothetical protein
MRTQKISFMPYGMRFLLVLFILAGSFMFPASHLAYAHTFSSSESAQFLSLVDQIRAETALVTTNLENNSATLAQVHVEKASSLLNNSTLDEIREVNNRIADSLETSLEQLEENVTSLSAVSQGQQVPQDRIQTINDTVISLNDILAEAVTVRIESEQQNNATTWAMVLADLVNVVLSNYGNATGAPFDLTNMSNLAGVEGMEMDHTGNMTRTMMNEDQMQTSSNSSDSNTMTMTANATSAMSNMTTTIVDASAYQSTQYLANNTTLQLFNDVLKPLTISANETSTDNNNATAMAQQGQNNITPGNNMASNIDALEAKLLQLKDDINGKVTPTEVMTTVHLGIDPLLIQLYGLTIEQEGGDESDGEMGQ